MSSSNDPNDADDHDGLLDRLDDFKHRVEDAAIQAEFETGEREETVEEAKANALVRVARMTLGFIVVIIGIIALPLPGPGWLIIAAGLTILSKDVAWADRLLRYIRKRVPGIPEDGKIPRSSLVTMAVITLAAVSASLWWTFARGSDELPVGTFAVTDAMESFASVPTPITDVEIEFTAEGAFIVDLGECEVRPEPVERDKSAMTLVVPDASTCETATGLFNRNGDGEALWTLDYETDGLVAWFFADDELTAVTSGDGTTHRLEPVE